MNNEDFQCRHPWTTSIHTWIVIFLKTFRNERFINICARYSYGIHLKRGLWCQIRVRIFRKMGFYQTLQWAMRDSMCNDILILLNFVTINFQNYLATVLNIIGKL